MKKKKTYFKIILLFHGIVCKLLLLVVLFRFMFSLFMKFSFIEKIN